jgi:hypothetical protein
MFFLAAMRMFETDLYSPFATCKSELGDSGLPFYPLPFHWMYALFGALGRFLRLPEFHYFAWINAAGFLSYCVAVFALFRVVSPRHAVRAMTVFLLGGGLGGVLFVMTGIAGLHDAPNFEMNFGRFARYQLIEGATLLPTLQAGRLYYTLPRALGIAAVVLLIIATRKQSMRGTIAAAAVLALGTLANMNLGAMACIVAMFYLFAGPDASGAFRWRSAGIILAAMAVPWIFSIWMVSQSPTYLEDARSNAAQALWFGPLVCASLFHVAAAAPAIRRLTPSLPRIGQWLVAGGVGYLVTFAIFYVGFQAYWGNWLAGGDFSAAVAISDWALIGGLLGVGWSIGRTGFHPLPAFPLKGEEIQPTVTDTKTSAAVAVTNRDISNVGWVVIWFLAFACVGISAFGQGWFLRLTPTRFGWMLGPPLALLVAVGLAQIELTRPRIARVLFGALIFCGATSTLVSAFYFTGPWGRQPGEGLFAGSHCEYMTEEDALLLAEYDGGVFLAPAQGTPFFGDVIAMRRDAKVVYGLGTYDFGDQMMTQLAPRVDHFYSPSATNDERREFIREYCVEWVFCPDTVPVNRETIDQLRQAAWLRPFDEAGRGVLFSVELLTQEAS